MIHRQTLIFAALLLPLAACSSEKAADDAETSPTTSQPAHPEPAAPWDAKAKAGREAGPTPVAPPTGSAEPAIGAGKIPSPVQGRWGLVAADCTSTRGDAKGLLVIDAISLKFYESVGELTRVREQDASRIVGEFAFSGEGQTWSRVMTLDAQDGGQTLVRRENGEGAAPGPLRYMRCKG